MNQNTRRSFLGTACAAVAAFFGFRPIGFRSEEFLCADKEAGIIDFHIRIARKSKTMWHVIAHYFNENGREDWSKKEVYKKVV